MRKKLYTRRETIGIFVSMAIASSCMPVKVVFNAGKEPEGNYDSTLRAFSEVIIPEARCDAPGLSDVFYDKYYPFLQYVKILAEDLDKASRRKYQTNSFSDLSISNRTETSYITTAFVTYPDNKKVCKILKIKYQTNKPQKIKA